MKLTKSQQAKFDKVMSEWKAGKLHSGSSDGPIVKDQDQAIAIAYAQVNAMKKMEFGGLVYDDLSEEAKHRIDGLVPIEQLNMVLSNCRYIVSVLMEDGFELDEVISFIVYKIVDDFTDKQYGYFSDEYYPEDWKETGGSIDKYIAYIQDSRRPGGSNKEIYQDYGLKVTERDSDGFNVIGSKKDIEDFVKDHSIILENDIMVYKSMDQGGSIDDDQIEEYAEAIYEDLRQEYEPWELKYMTMEEATMAVDSYDEIPDNLKEQVASYLMNMASQNEFFEDYEDDEEYEDGGSVKSKQEKMIESKAKAIFRDLKRDGYDKFDLATMTKEEAIETVDNFSDVPDDLKKDVANYLFMLCQRISFEKGGSMYNKGGVIENKMQDLENELSRLESELKWTQQQSSVSKQYYLRKKRSGKMTREKAMKLIDESAASWKREREKVRQKIQEVKDRIKRLEELSSKINADQFANGGGLNEDAVAEAQKLMDELGVMVVPDPQNYGNQVRLNIYPNSEPGDRFYDGRSAQRFTVVVDNGQYLFSNGGGYRRSIQPIALLFGVEANNNTGVAGRSSIDISLNKKPVSLTTIRMISNYFKQGLKDESKAEADFYKNWRNPD